MQVLAISPPLDQGVVMDRVLTTENKEARKEIMQLVLQFLSRLGFDLSKVTVVMDAYCRVRLRTYGTDIKPILSTAEKHLKSSLMETLETMNVNDADGNGLFSPTSYDYVRSNIAGILSCEAFVKKLRDARNSSREKMAICEGFDWRSASDNLDDYLSVQQLDDWADEVNGEAEVVRMMRVEMQNALNAIFLLAALELDDRDMLIKYGERFLSLVDATRHEVSGPCTDRHDHIRSIARLVSNAKADLNFSLGYYNMALSYHMRNIHLSQMLTTPYLMKNPVAETGYETVTFRRPITFQALLTADQQTTIQRITKHCDKYSAKKGTTWFCVAYYLKYNGK